MNAPPSLFEKIDSFFEHVAILELQDEQKQKTALTCNTQMRGDLAYWCQVVISSVIATLGLLQNSVAVIIGAMLIAPLFRPIQGMAFGIATGNQTVFWRASLLLLKSVAVGVAFAAMSVLIIPFNVETSEILARTTPNLIDLLIAIASALIAFLAIYFEELSESIGGVAMATSLMPPLAVVGIELAFGNLARSWGSLFLFLTNLFAIVLVGTCMFFFYGFSPHQELSQRATLQKLGVLSFLGLLIVIPLGSSLLNVSDAVNLRLAAQEQGAIVLHELLPTATLSEIELLEHSRHEATLRGTMTLPEGIELLAETQEAIQQKLSEKLKRDIALNLQVLRVASIVTKKDRVVSLEQRLRESFRTHLLEKLPSATVVKIDVAQLQPPAVPEIKPEEDVTETIASRWGIKSVLALPPDAELSSAIQEQLRETMHRQFSDILIEFFWVALPEQSHAIVKNMPPRQQHVNELSLKWDSFFAEALPAQATIEDFQITWEKVDPALTEFSIENISQYTVKFSLYLPETSPGSQKALIQTIRTFSQALEKPTTLSYRIIPVFSVQIVPQS